MLSFYFLVLIVFGIYYLTKRDRRLMSLYKQMPCDTMLLPIIGHSHLYLGSSERTMKAFRIHGEEATKKGGLMGLWHANNFFIVVTDAVALDYILKFCLDKDDLMQLTKLVLGNSSIFAPVPIWRPRRRLLVPSFNSKKLNAFVDIFSQQSFILVDKLKHFAGKGSVSVWKYMLTYSINAVCESTMGIKLHEQNSTYNTFLNTIQELFKMAAERMTRPWLHNDFLYKNVQYRIVEDLRKSVYNFVDKIIVERRASAATEAKDDENSKTSCFKSFMDMMIESSVDGKGFTDVELREETLLLILAGTDTSATGAAFTLLMLSKHQDVQEKVYQELQEVFGNSDRPVIAEDLPHLKYLEVVIKESLRLYPPAPIITRKLDRDHVLPSGVTLYKGSGILVHIWGVHRNPLYWGADADKFRPERFLEGPIKHPAAFLAFSYTPRGCIASQYAIMSMKTNMANILRNYKVLPAPDPKTGKMPAKDEQLRVKFDISLRHADNFVVQLENRH